jgi:hypothetical protein
MMERKKGTALLQNYNSDSYISCDKKSIYFEHVYAQKLLPVQASEITAHSQEDSNLTIAFR